MPYIIKAGGAALETQGSSFARNNYSGYPVSKAFNNAASHTDCWISTNQLSANQRLPTWCGFQFTSAQIIKKYVIWPREWASTGQSNVGGMFSEFKLQGSNDGSNYTDLDHQTGVLGWGPGGSTTLPPTTSTSDIPTETNCLTFLINNTNAYTYYRIYIISQSGLVGVNGVTGMGQLGLFTYSPYVLEIGAGGLNGTGGAQGTVTSSSQLNSTYSNVKAFNNILNNQAWFSSTNSSTEWLQFQAPSAKTIAMYRIWPRYHASGGIHIRAPKTWTFQGSNNGSSWTTLDSQSNITSWSLTQTTSITNLTHYKEYVISSPGSYTYYRITITAANNDNYKAIGELGLYSPEITVPDAPTNLAVSVASNTSVNLSWTAPSGTVASYKIERSADNSNWSTIVAAHTSGTTYTNTGLTTGTYYYRVSATNGAGTGSSTSAVQVVLAPPVPDAPTNLAVSTASSTSVNLSWTAPSGTVATSYKIERSTDNSNWSTIVATHTNGTTYTNSGLTTAVTYYYRVSATNNDGTGAASSVVNHTIPVSVASSVSGLSLNASVANQITASWTAPSDNGGAAITGYKVEVSYIGGEEFVVLSANTGTATTNYVLPEKVGGGDYSFRISAINSVGTGSSLTSSHVHIPIANTHLLISSVGTVTGTRKLDRNSHSVYVSRKPSIYYVQGDTASVEAVGAAPAAPGTGGKIYSLVDGKAYFKSSSFSGSLEHPLTNHTDGLKLASSNLGIKVSPTQTLTVGGDVNISGSLITSGLTFPSGTGSSGQYVGTNGSGTLTFQSVSGSGSLPALVPTRTSVLSAVLSSASQNINDEYRYYCWDTSADTADLKYTTGTTQGANSLIHIKGSGDYLISSNLYVADGGVSGGSGTWMAVALYTGQNNNTARGTLDYEYYLDAMYNSDDAATHDKSLMGGSLRINISDAMVSAGCQIEVVSRRLFSANTSGTSNCDASGSKIHIEKYAYAYS